MQPRPRVQQKEPHLETILAPNIGPTFERADAFEPGHTSIDQHYDCEQIRSINTFAIAVDLVRWRAR